jgi:hypothetical protein
VWLDETAPLGPYAIALLLGFAFLVLSLGLVCLLALGLQAS